MHIVSPITYRNLKKELGKQGLFFLLTYSYQEHRETGKNAKLNIDKTYGSDHLSAWGILR